MTRFLKLLLLILPFIINGQEFNSPKLNLPSGLSLSNQLEYSYDTNNKNEIFEDWLNLDYGLGIFSAGIRLEIFQPNDPNPSISRGKEKYADIAYKYITAKIGSRRNGVNVTVGNYYGSFGRGIVLKSYEDRNVRVDNNLLGLFLEGRYAKFHFKALTGSAANINNERKDLLHGLDLEYLGIKKVKMGFSLASNRAENNNEATTNLLGFRINPNFNFMDIYSEYAVRLNNDIKEKIFNNSRDIVGKAFYANLNIYHKGFSILSEVKYYDNFNFTSKDGTVQYNTGPAVIRDYTYILLNRHPYALNQNNEKGLQIEANYVFDDNTSFTASYGITKSIGNGSIYNEFIGIDAESRDLLKEGYFQLNHKWNSKLNSIFVFGLNEEASTGTKNITPIIENVFQIDETNSIKLVLEHQQTKNEQNNEKYYSDVFTLEYLSSPNISISFVGEMKTSEPETGKIKRNYWGFIQTSYKLNDYIDLSLLVGSRQAGNICIGGVCRYEPEFEGIEFKMLTRLY